MAQPEYVPILPTERPRATERLPAAERWLANRPGEVITGAHQPTGRLLGNPGPDQGYALKLARLFEPRMVVAEGEHLDDAMAVVTALALRRAASFGRAPVIFDIEGAAALFGFAAGAPGALIGFRRPLVAGAAHDYSHERTAVDRVREDALRLSPAQASELAQRDWQAIFSAA